jgi:hypothetical protein
LRCGLHAKHHFFLGVVELFDVDLGSFFAAALGFFFLSLLCALLPFAMMLSSLQEFSSKLLDGG